MITNINIEEFFGLQGSATLLDVRTPAEFTHAHIPGAQNLPIFSDEERVKVGTTYKQVGREEAILLGFELTGPKWAGFIKQALILSPDKKVTVHCWRGGMRSGAMAWALNLYGFEVYVLEGGYKTYRRWVHRQFERDHKLLIIGGMTGSGKTEMLKKLVHKGEQIIDLEELAQHQGSSYGTMNRMIQPTQEQFENDMAYCLSHLNPLNTIWVEDESLTIGKRAIPGSFWNQMREARLINLQVDAGHRLKKLVTEYGDLDKDFLIACTQRIHKRLGPEQTKYAITAINGGDMETFIKIVLVYYDKTYKAGLTKRAEAKVYNLSLDSVNADKNVTAVLALAATLKN